MLRFQLERDDGESRLYSYLPGTSGKDKGYVSISSDGTASVLSCPDADSVGYSAMHLKLYLEELYEKGDPLPDSGGYSWF
jgi:hypothetical protein